MTKTSGANLLITIIIAFIVVQSIDGGILNIFKIIERLHGGKINKPLNKDHMRYLNGSSTSCISDGCDQNSEYTCDSVYDDSNPNELERKKRQCCCGYGYVYGYQCNCTEIVMNTTCCCGCCCGYGGYDGYGYM